MLGTLHVVATPIGNLQDITLRALEVLKTVDLVACEDTRHTGRLLKHFSIFQKLISYHEHNEIKRSDELIEFLKIGKSIAVVSDAGTPGICDPSFRLVQKAREIGAKITVVPGAAAFVSAVVISGLPTDSIYFGGFLPSKKGDRRKRLKEIKGLSATLCFYESPHRLSRSLDDCFAVLGDRRAVVVRELTKLYEEVIAGGLHELSGRFKDEAVKGEIVLIIDRSSGDDTSDQKTKPIIERVEELAKEGLDQKKALKKISREFGVSKSEVYRMYQAEKDS